MALRKLLTSAAALASLLLCQTIQQADACRCASREICEHVESSEVVLRATVLSRSEQVETYDDVTYSVSITALYKEEPDVMYSEEISFVTNGSSAACGVSLELGTEYLLGLGRTTANPSDSDTEAQLTVNSCGLVLAWSSVTDEDKTALAGCTDDACDGACDEFQECLFFTDGFTEEHYCADVCDPSPCSEDEVCTLQEVQCIRAPCPPMATCTDPCT